MSSLRYIIYCRKSTEDSKRQLLSLDAQEKELKDIAIKHNLNVIAVYRESKSAKNPGREVFNKVLNEIEKGKADALLCWKLDRLSRNFIDSGKLIHYLQNSIIKEIRTHEGIYYPDDSVYKSLFTLGQANEYSRDLSKDVKRGNREKLDRGEWPGVAPFGYKNDMATKKIVIDHSKAPFVKRIYELYAENKSYSDISDILYSEGLRTKSGGKVFKGLIQKILKSKFYVGLMERNGKVYQGIHEPIVNLSLYEKVQNLSDLKSRPRPSKHVFAFSGFLTCGNCGCVITATRAKGHDYYYCTNGKKICSERKSYMREEYLYEKVSGVLSKLEFGPKVIDLMYKAALERSGQETKETTFAVETLQKELDGITSQESRLLDVFVEGNIQKDVYEEKLLDIRNKKVELINQISRRKEASPSVTFEQVKKVFEQGNTIRNEFLNASTEKKKELLKNVLSNLTIKGREILITQYKSPYHLLANSPKKLTISQGLGCKDSNLN